ncbi:hypothetical protein [Flavobacterium sp.]|jgi:hypothetical protein|uniref:hypothetical protein n=1 Tax=Flavobacterium sp. TaxID=239 RepID=UPI002A812C86|nr:hypothetical protein [Flavobacterium sp.]
MNIPFYTRITKGKAAKSFREGNKTFVMDHPEHMDELVKIAFTVADKNHHKAFWPLELICEVDCSYFEPYINTFCKLLLSFTKDHTKRPVSRICMFLAKSNKITLTKNQEQLIIENCFDWLIKDEKVAVKAYAMKALYELSKTNKWIIPDLKQIISADYPNQSTGYKACTREILKKLK